MKCCKRQQPHEGIYETSKAIQVPVKRLACHRAHLDTMEKRKKSLNPPELKPQFLAHQHAACH
jgi:hypothetical protein